jgi:hypothetical protein
VIFKTNGSWKRRMSAGAAIACLALVAPATANNASAAPADHCLVTVAGKDKSDNFIVKSTTCFTSFSAVLRSAGIRNVPDLLSPADPLAKALIQTQAAFGVQSVIGVHFDASNGSGASLTVNGSNCIGGGLNVSLSWNDRISSTLNGCPTIIHYENTNYAGSTFTTFGAGNTTPILGYMDNRTSSIKYF